MKKCHCRTHPLNYDSPKTVEIRVTERDCDVPNCVNNSRNLKASNQVPGWSWYMNSQPLRSNRSRTNKYRSQSIFGYLLRKLSESSISGVNKIFSAKNWFQRILWILVLAFCIVGFGYQTLKFLRIYYKKPSVVQTEVENDGMADFPAVTVCSTNRLRRSILCEFMPDKCGPFKNASLTESEIGDIIYDLIAAENHTQKFLLGHSTNMVQDCQFNGHPHVTSAECHKMLEHFYDPDFGNCFTIPGKNLEGHILEAREADFWQEQSDLSILLDVEVDELVESTRHPGIKLTLHDDSFSPDIHTDGQLIEPGMSYSIAISKTSVFLLPSPYKTNCTDFEELPWHTGYKRRITSRMCTVGCSQYYQKEKCNFVTKSLSLFYDRLPYNPEGRTDDDRICAEDQEMNTKEYCRSLCGLPCSDIVFEVDVEINELTREDLIEFHLRSSVNRTWKEKMENLALVKVYFINLENRIYRHVPKYDTMELFSYLGGYSGVWLGFSLLTVYELIEILLSTVRFALQKHFREAQSKKMLKTTTKKFTKKRRHFR
ncbi:hypothetical protein JTE90_008379 [Oedothorax gibbosus]|uniref:Uncharacterized protein n=1 Tax=Oedothorax gibbosus TaxID=931172 RepID=A0AAV6V2Z4_9ARAC|nr:hypothetical protein JTE90_008379 [Oedothorax gibbosus]